MIPILSAACIAVAMFFFGFAAGHIHSGWLRSREERKQRQRDREWEQHQAVENLKIRVTHLEEKRP